MHSRRTLHLTPFTPHPFVQVILPEIHKTFAAAASTAEAQEKLAEVQGQLCGVLQVILQKLSEAEHTKTAVAQSGDAVRHPGPFFPFACTPVCSPAFALSSSFLLASLLLSGPRPPPLALHSLPSLPLLVYHPPLPSPSPLPSS
jgi:hypothetical protein